jgi:hypothetical protein
VTTTTQTAHGKAWRASARESMRRDRDRIAELQAQGMTAEQAWAQLIKEAA